MYRVLRILSGCIAAFLAIAASPSASANSKYAAFVEHAYSGDVLFSRYADAPRYPASLTKMMTLYLLFEELEAGRMTLDTELTASRHAAAQPPSKLGIKAGDTITVEKAIDALIVKSANDIAVVVGEAIGGGSESRFARMMTAKARELGMRHTTFRNASGLPNRRQVTTARDLATLGQRVSQDFPQYFPYFAVRSFQYGGRTYRTHNRLILSYDGADGMKTGYTRLSGFNLVTTATRDGDRLIGVVLGGRTSVTRDAFMKKILDNAFAEIADNPMKISAVYRTPPTPDLKPSVAMAFAKANGAPSIGGNKELQAQILAVAQTFSPPETSTDADAQQPQPVLVASLDTGDLNRRQAAELALTPIAVAESGTEAPTSEGDIDSDAPSRAPTEWAVQIGAFSTPERAAKELGAAEKRLKTNELATATQAVTAADTGKKTLYRARFTGMTEDAAEAACLALRSAGVVCLKVADAAS